MKLISDGLNKEAKKDFQFKAKHKSPSGGLSEAGRKAYNRATGSNLKRPQPEGGSRRDSFCARMKGMKKKLTSKETSRDPDSRINKALRKWKCSHVLEEAIKLASKPGLWDNIHAKRKRGEAPAKPGEEGYPDKKNWKEVTQESDKEARCWKGYEPVPGKKPLTKGSCRPISASKETEKKAVKLITGKPTEKSYGLLDKLVFENEELRSPTAKDFKKWKAYANYMQNAAPQQLSDLQILSGSVNPEVLVNNLRKRRSEDTFLEDISGDRQLYGDAYAAMTPLQIANYDASYHPLPNAVLLNEASRAALIHELGHSIDMSRAKDESNFNRWLRNAFKPRLAEEVKAWNKGSDALREGFAQSKDYKKEKIKQDIIAALHEARGKKYPALGTYFGGTLGAIAGGLLPLYLSHKGIIPKSVQSGRVNAYLAAAGAALGGFGGTYAGAGAGSLLKKMMAKRHKTKEERLMAEAILKAKQK